jgi:hypothetical protein
MEQPARHLPADRPLDHSESLVVFITIITYAVLIISEHIEYNSTPLH